MFAQVVDKVKPGDEWTGPLTDRTSAVKLFQEAGKTYLDNHQFDAAVRLAEPFAAVAAPGEAEVLRGKASAEWARARQRRDQTGAGARGEAGRGGRGARPVPPGGRGLRRGRRKGAERPRAGRVPLAAAPIAAWEGRELEQASARLEKVLKIEATSDERNQDWYIQREGEGWYPAGRSASRPEGRRRRQRGLPRVHQVPDAVRLPRPLPAGAGGGGAGRPRRGAGGPGAEPQAAAQLRPRSGRGRANPFRAGRIFYNRAQSTSRRGASWARP